MNKYEGGTFRHSRDISQAISVALLLDVCLSVGGPESDDNTIHTSRNSPDTRRTCCFSTAPHFWAVLDPEIACENQAVEDKYRRLVRSYRSSQCDRELKPSARIRD